MPNIEQSTLKFSKDAAKLFDDANKADSQQAKDFDKFFKTLLSYVEQIANHTVTKSTKFTLEIDLYIAQYVKNITGNDTLLRACGFAIGGNNDLYADKAEITFNGWDIYSIANGIIDYYAGVDKDAKADGDMEVLKTNTAAIVKSNAEISTKITKLETTVLAKLEAVSNAIVAKGDKIEATLVDKLKEVGTEINKIKTDLAVLSQISGDVQTTNSLLEQLVNK